jgi:hypothetical protein
MLFKLDENKNAAYKFVPAQEMVAEAVGKMTEFASGSDSESDESRQRRQRRKNKAAGRRGRSRSRATSGRNSNQPSEVMSD